MTNLAFKPAQLLGRTKRPVRRRPRSHVKWAALGFMAPVVLFLGIFFVYPIVRGLVLSFQDFGPKSFVTGRAPFVGFGNYISVFGDQLFATVAWHTVIFTVVSLAGQFGIGLVLAVFFTRKFPLSTTFRSLIMLPWLLPLMVSATAWRWIFDQQFGILNSALGAQVGWLTDPSISLWSVIIANIWLGIPFNMVLLYGGLQAVPENLYEAAALDGASSSRAFWSITWPLLRPVTAVTLLLGLVYTIKVFDVIWILTKGGPANSSHTLATWAYDKSFTDLQFGVGAAVGEILVVVALIFGFIYIRAQRKEALQ